MLVVQVEAVQRRRPQFHVGEVRPFVSLHIHKAYPGLCRRTYDQYQTTANITK